MKIWIHKTGKWYHYFKPTWLNTASWKIGEPKEPKIYRWLFWGYYVKNNEKCLDIKKL